MVMDKRSELEKRRIPRIWVNFNAVVIWEGKKFHCQARQLSAGGILLATPHKELVGKDIQLELMLQPPSAVLLLSGMVVYVNPAVCCTLSMVVVQSAVKDVILYGFGGVLDRISPSERSSATVALRRFPGGLS